MRGARHADGPRRRLVGAGRLDPRPGPRPMAEIRHGQPARGGRGARRARDLHARGNPVLGGRGWPSTWAPARCSIDLSAGAVGAAAGIVAAAEALDCDLLVGVDVGGDVLAHGDEPGLASPLCDAVMVAAALHASERLKPRAGRGRPGLRRRAEHGRGPRANRRPRAGRRLARHLGRHAGDRRRARGGGASACRPRRASRWPAARGVSSARPTSEAGGDGWSSGPSAPSSSSSTQPWPRGSASCRWSAPSRTPAASRRVAPRWRDLGVHTELDYERARARKAPSGAGGTGARASRSGYIRRAVRRLEEALLDIGGRRAPRGGLRLASNIPHPPEVRHTLGRPAAEG